MMTVKSEGAADLVRKAFIDPIRTVMLIDDLFPTLGAAVDAACRSERPERPQEWERAGRLWQGCRSRRWLCDIENRYEWSADDVACIAGSDLIVLDYHLEGGESEPAHASRRLLRRLAEHNHTNLVVVYTSKSDLDGVRDEIIAGLRGHRDWKALLRTDDGRLEEAFNRLLKDKDTDGVFRKAYLPFCRGDTSWAQALGPLIEKVQKQFEADEPDEEWGNDWSDRLGDALAEFLLAEKAAPRVEAVQVVHAGPRWIECGNVFVTLMTKSNDPPEDEIGPLIQQLEAALVEWSPSAMRAAVSLARAEVRRAGLRGEALSMPDTVLEAGWWYSMLTAHDETAQRGRARQLAVDLIAGVGDVVADTVGEFIAAQAPAPSDDHGPAMGQARELAGLTDSGKTDFTIGHALNVFLSCERGRPSRVGCGTILAIRTENQESPSYVVTVSPACDMTPWEPNGSYHWLHGLHPWRPTLALGLKPVEKDKDRDKALASSTISRWLFVEHDDKRLVLALRPNPSTEQLTHETLLIELSEESTGAPLAVHRLIRDGGKPTLSPATADIVAQLRAPFAEHVLALAGQHLSRIGTDYFGVPVRRRKK